jgi:membrane-associated protease RseP (regulator of RpoE activity)
MSDTYTWNPFNNTNNQINIDIELLKTEIGKHFPFYDMKYNANNAAFYCRIEKESIDEKFESLRTSLSDKGYIPLIRFEQGEYIIYISKKPKIKKRPIWINYLLLIATVITTTFAGSILWVEMEQATLMDIVSPNYLLKGLVFFSIPLLSILGIHEMGHYYISKKHNLDTSLPFFIPLPPPFILGTFGAIISTREPIPDRKTLLDVGVAGPLCGFLVAIPVCIIGLFLMQQNPVILTSTEGGIIILNPLILQGLSSFFTIPTDAVMHPTLFAGWVGLFLTAINLLPVGQLDGGHIARALLKDKHRYASWAVIIAIMGAGMFNTGFLFLAFIIILLIGTKHQPPLNELTPLDTKRIMIGVLALIVFIICFAPFPFSTV